MNLSHAAAAFGAVFLAELPDKTMFTSLVLTTRTKRPAAVFCGAAMAFAFHASFAAAAGGLVHRLPRRPVRGVVGVLFAIGAIVLWRDSLKDDDADDADDNAGGVPVGSRLPVTFRGIMWLTFGLVFVAEWGDLTQLTGASLAASTGDPIMTGAGAFLAEASVAALAAFLGSRLVSRVNPKLLKRGAAIVFLTFAALALFDALG